MADTAATGKPPAANTGQEHRTVSARNRLWGPSASALATLTCWGVGTFGAVLALWAVPLVVAAAGVPDDERFVLAVTTGVVVVLVVVLSLLLQFVPGSVGDRTPWRTSFVLLLVSVPVGGYAVAVEEQALLLAVAVATTVGAFVLVRWRVTGRRLMWRVPLALIGYFGLVGGLALGLPKGEQLWRDSITGDQSAYEAVVLDHPDWELVLAEHHASIDEFHVVYTHSSDGTEVRVSTYMGGFAPPHACAEAEGTLCQEIDVMAIRMSEDDPDRIDNVRLKTQDGDGLVELRWDEHAQEVTGFQEQARYLRPAEPKDTAELDKVMD